jgi:integrase/recombinase XerD
MKNLCSVGTKSLLGENQKQSMSNRSVNLAFDEPPHAGLPALVAGLPAARDSMLGRSLAVDDDAAIATWLSVFQAKNTRTVHSYRSQSTKWRRFLELLHPERPNQYQIKLATEQDAIAYELALSHRTPEGKPQPTSNAFLLTPDQLQAHGWKKQPFAQPLKRSSVNQALAVVHAMYDYLREPNAAMTEAYVAVNPLRRVLKSGIRTPRKTERILPQAAVQSMNIYVLRGIETARALGDEATTRLMERRLWMLTLLFGLWTRREEITRLEMGSFCRSPNRQWQVRLHRKGDREHMLAVPDWVIAGLRRYRASIGLPEQWLSGDTTPALLDLRFKGLPCHKKLSAHTLYIQIKNLASETAIEIESGRLLQELGDEEKGEIVGALQRCSPHWFRHTGPSLAINSGTMTLAQAAEVLDHKSTSTTWSMYYHGDDNQTRAGLEKMAQFMAP